MDDVPVPLNATVDAPDAAVRLPALSTVVAALNESVPELSAIGPLEIRLLLPPTRASVPLLSVYELADAIAPPTLPRWSVESFTVTLPVRPCAMVVLSVPAPRLMNAPEPAMLPLNVTVVG